MVVTIRNDTKAKSYGELNRTETRALSGSDMIPLK